MENQKPVMRTFDTKPRSKVVAPGKVVAIVVVVILLGIGTGFGASQFTKTGSTIGSFSPGGIVSKGKIVGSSDTKTFKDIAEGTLKNGGINGEGQYHLERSGGDSQNVYLTSSIVDLSQFVGKKIKVWGQTQAAQTAGWLMDVGKVEVL